MSSPGVAQVAELAKKPFTVRDSIELTKVFAFSSGINVNPVSGTALFPPDRSQFVIHTRRGDLKKNRNIESLLLFNTKEVEAYLVSQEEGERPVPRTLVQLEIGEDWGEMSHIQWLNAAEVGFTAQGDKGQNQAFVANVDSGSVSQLTLSETAVSSFAVSGDRILFYAHMKTIQTQASPVGKRSIYDVLIPDGPTDTAIELFQGSRSGGEVQRINVPAMRLAPDFLQIWLSPSGDCAVIFSPAINAPKHWADYKVPDYELLGYTPNRVSSDPTSWDLALRTRYQVIDLRKNAVTPLLDAPSAWLSQNRTPTEVFWSEDGRSVIVSNTYLPLDVKDPKVRERRTLAPAIAEVDLISGEVTVVAWEPVLTQEQIAAGMQLEPIVSIDWNAESNLLTVAKKTSKGEIVYEGFQKIGRDWRQMQVAGVKAPRGVPAIDLRESLNERPKVYAMGGTCACQKVLFDPNPQADQFTFGRAEVFKWTDKNDIEWQGGLIYPSDYVPGQRYPLIVQTHGFQPDEFLIDGPYGGTTAMAAQAFANAGFVVLQVRGNRQAITLDEQEGPRFAEGYRSAIEELVIRGIVDRTKVGLIGFSRTGYHALHALAQYPDLLAAATISDAIQQGYMSDLLLVNYDKDSVVQMRKLSGGAPSFENIGQWFTRNPMYKLPRVSAAVRLEANGPGSVIGLWETYAVLRNANKAVDFIYFPKGSHVLKKPAERMGSQGGNVDWFRFWLQGYEDPDPVKAEQYACWRELRRQHEENMKKLDGRP